MLDERPEIHSVDFNSLSTFSAFGMPIVIKDDETIDLVTGDIQKEKFQMNGKLNYSVISVMPCELYKVNKTHFVKFVKDRPLFQFTSKLIR